MKYITRNIDREVSFSEDQIKEAAHYWDIEEECKTIEEIADNWNNKHSGEAIGELIIYEI